jgi:hypothetical protein
VGSEDLAASLLADAVGQRELEVLGEELLDVRATDVVGLLDLNDLEDLRAVSLYFKVAQRVERTWTDLKRDR